MPRQLVFGFLTALCALVLVGLNAARAGEPRHIMMVLEPWLAQAATLESQTGARADRLAHLTGDWRKPVLLEDGYIAHLERFTYETETLSGALREEPQGDEPACILKGLALDLSARAERLRLARSAEEARLALQDIAQLLREPQLIFRAETAALGSPVRLVPAVAAPCPSFGPDGSAA